MSSLNDQILGYLECPVCFEYIHTRIYNCNNGHLVCSRCRQKLTDCCVCRATFATRTNLFAEKVADAVVFPCPNASSGCLQKLEGSALKQHLLDCTFDCRCYVEECVADGRVSEANGVGIKVQRKRLCGWRGAKSGLTHHVKDVHGDFYVGGQARLTTFSKIDQLEILTESRLIEAFGEIFWMFLSIPTDNTECVGMVKHLTNASEKPNQFYYKIEFAPSDVSSPQYVTQHHLLSRITVKGTIVSFDSSADDCEQNCFVLARKSVQSLTTTKDRAIVYSIQIKRFLNI